MNKVQFMVSVDPPVLDRLDALRIVMGVSRAEVNRQALVGQGLRGLEVDYRARLARLDAVAEKYGTDTAAYVRGVVEGRQNAPSLEDIEAGSTPHGKVQIG